MERSDCRSLPVQGRRLPEAAAGKGGSQLQLADGKPGKADLHSVPGPSKARVLLHAYVAGPCLQGPGPGPGKALDTEEGPVGPDDYVTWAPGAQVTLHNWREGLGTLCAQPPNDCLEVVLGTLCAQGPPIALGTLRNGQKPAFRHFPAKSRLLADSGGPSLPSGQLLTETSKVARMATLRLFASWDPWYPWIRDGSRSS